MATWQWRDDSDNFIDYDSVFASRVEALFRKGVLVGEVGYSGTKYKLCFTAFTQQNLESGKVRHIRRNEPQWFYFEDNGTAKPYNPSDSQSLESAAAAAIAGNTTSFVFNMFNTNYTIDLTAMTQTNPDSGKVRKIVRRGGLAPLTVPASASSATVASGDDGAPAAKISQVETAGGAKKSVAASLCTNIYTPASAASASATADASSASSKSAATPNYGAAAKSSGSGATTAIMKGGGVVDVHSGLQHTYHIHTDTAKGIHYQCMLNQTNISQNNNKYYVIQLLAPDAGVSGSIYVFTRWGRVGSPGQQSLDAFSDTGSAMTAFKKKFREKTQNDWEQSQLSGGFVKVPGKYHLMDIDLGGGGGGGTSSTAGAGASAAAAAAAAGPIPDSALHPSIQRVMKLISNKQEMAQVLKELKIDTDKMPLGKISKKQIKEAFEHLKAIEGELAKAGGYVHERGG